MATTTMIAIAVVVLFVLLAVRTPVALALTTAGAVGLLLLTGFGPTMSALGQIPFHTIASYTLLIIPFFIAMGVFAKEAGIAEEGFDLMGRRFNWLPAGPALATIAGCALFAAVSGSSAATVATMAQMSIDEMTKYGYPRRFAAGVVAASGTLGILIPPSIVLVVYAIISGESVGSLLIAGIIPGIVSAILYGAAILFATKHFLGSWRVKAPPAPVMDSEDTTSKLIKHRIWVRDLGVIAKVVLLFGAVMGGLYLGFFTPTESAAVGAMIALIYVGVRIVRGRSELVASSVAGLRDAAAVVAMVFALMVGGAVFSHFLVATRAPAELADWLVNADLPDNLVVIIILLVVGVLGMFIDGLSILLIVVPLVHPAVTALGFDGIWFAILIVKMIEVGIITPPLGINAFIVSGAVKDLSVEQVFRGVLWFVPIDLFTIAVFFVFPGLITFLPSLM